MERYGYLIVDASSEDSFKDVHVNLYTNIIACVTSAKAKKIATNERIVYFKILKNADIVELLHAEEDNYGFGYCFLKRASVNEPFKITDSSEKFYTHVLHCVTSAKNYFSGGECFNANVKIGYFRVLTDDDVVKTLHLPCYK